MNKPIGSEQDGGGFTIKTERVGDRWKASVPFRPEIKPVLAAKERIAIEGMTTRLDELSKGNNISNG